MDWQRSIRRGRGTAADESDVTVLHELGYAQRLLREMGGFSNFAISFTIISILAGTLTLYGYGMTTGGPITITIGWVVVAVFVTIIGLSMAEICSVYPTAGGLYYWSAKLAPPRQRAAWSWMVGWFDVMGEVGVTAGIDFGLALFATALLNLLWGYPTTAPWVILIYGVILFVHGMLNTFGVKLVRVLNDLSVWWHIVSVLFIVCVLFFIPQHHQSASFVFTKFVNQTGWHASWYVLLLGLLLAQYTFTGYHASIHMTEETKNSRTAPSWGIVMSIVLSFVFGWILLIAVTAAIQHYNGAINSPTGVPPVQIWIDAVGRRLGELMLFLVVGAQFYCGMASVTSNSRMIFAFSRDDAIPGARLWKRINPRTRTPTNSCWAAAGAAFILGLPYLASPTAYAAVTSIAVIGLYIAYVTPVLLRRLQGHRFRQGVWNLGRWSAPLGWIAVAWTAFICVLFCLPTVSPVTFANFNYSVVSVAVVVFGAGGWYLVSARKWFKGPKVEGTAEELSAIERELEAAGTSPVPGVGEGGTPAGELGARD